MKKLVSLIMALAMMLSVATAVPASAEETLVNLAKDKVVYGAQADEWGCSDGAALTDGDYTTYTRHLDANEGLSDSAPVFVIDLGENYANYEIAKINLITPEATASTAGITESYNVFAADTYPESFAGTSETLVAAGAVKIGTIEDVSAAADAQQTYSLDVALTAAARYILVSHEVNSDSYLSLAEVEVMGKDNTPKPEEEIDLSKCVNIAGKATVIGANNPENLVDEDYETYSLHAAGSVTNWTDLSMSFVFDLGENYDRYDIKQVKITSTPMSATVGHVAPRPWNAWASPSLPSIYNNTYFQRDNEMLARGAVKLGVAEDYESTATEQKTFTFDVSLEQSMRYIVVGHDAGIPAYMSIAEVEIIAAEKPFNIALGKTVYGGHMPFGSGYNGDGAALVDGNAGTFTVNGRWEVHTDLAAAFVIDLGEDYKKYDLESIEIVTDPDGAWTAHGYNRNFNAFVADNYLIYEDRYYTREITHGEMKGINANKLGYIEDISEATGKQATFKIKVGENVPQKRYVIISHELGVSSYLSLAEVRVLAKELPDYVNVAAGKEVFGSNNNALLNDGNYSTHTWADGMQGWDTHSAAFVVDLGADYDKYDLKQVKITTTPMSHPQIVPREWNVWMSPGLPHIYGGQYYIRDEEYPAGAVKIGIAEGYENAANEQMTFTFDIPANLMGMRYVIIGHETGIYAFLQMAEIEVLAANNGDMAEWTNIATGKAAYGGYTFWGLHGDSSALTDGNIATWTINPAWEYIGAPAAAFYVDLGEDYAKYDVKRIDIVTPPNGAWAGGGYVRNYNAFLADGMLKEFKGIPNVGEANAYYAYDEDHGEMKGINATKIGYIEDISEAQAGQTMYSFDVDVDTPQRYVIIAHEACNASSINVLAEVKIWAIEASTDDEPEVEAGAYNIASFAEINNPIGDDREAAKVIIDGDAATAYEGEKLTIELNFGDAYNVLGYEILGNENAAALFSADGTTYERFTEAKDYRYVRIANAAGVSEVRIFADAAEAGREVNFAKCVFTDSTEAGGNEIPDLERNALGAEVSVINLTGGEKSADIILALYTDEGKLVNIKTDNITAPAYGNATTAVGFESDPETVGTNYVLKAMCWDMGELVSLDMPYIIVNP